LCRGSGGRGWWAQFTFTTVNIHLTILRNQIEDLMNVKGIGEKSFLKLKSLVTVSTTRSSNSEQ